MKISATACFLTVCLFQAPSTIAQQLVAGRFYPEKHQYLVGEPIVVNLEVTNYSRKLAELPQGGCPWMRQWSFEVDGAPPKKDDIHFSCEPQGFAGSCLVGAHEIQPGKKYLQRLLLDGPFSLKSPGIYHIRAKMEQAIKREGSNQLPTNLSVESEFDLTLRVPREGELEAAYRPFLNDLNGPDFEIRYFAATAIAQHPPMFVESALTKIVDNPGTTIANIVIASIVGLGRLATPGARTKLIQMSSAGSEEFRQPAIAALGGIGNPADCEAMLDIASKNQLYTQGEAYIFAARLCRERAVPVVTGLLANADNQLSIYLATALGNTSARSAMAPLIDLLGHSDKFVRRAADESLATLTHRHSQYGVATVESAEKSHLEWSNWFAANAETAILYDTSQCAEPKPLQ
jgi:hypothetical protein